MTDGRDPEPVGPGVIDPSAPRACRRAVLLGIGYVVLAALALLAVIGLLVNPAPIFVIDAAGAVYGLWALAHFSRRGPGGSGHLEGSGGPIPDRIREFRCRGRG